MWKNLKTIIYRIQAKSFLISYGICSAKKAIKVCYIFSIHI